MAVFQQQACCSYCCFVLFLELFRVVLTVVSLIFATFRTVNVGQGNSSTVLTWIRLKELSKLKDTVGIINALRDSNIVLLQYKSTH
jgi:hypothetical protein